jgi:hypothetical protein
MGEDQLRERIIARRGTIMMRPASSGRQYMTACRIEVSATENYLPS